MALAVEVLKIDYPECEAEFNLSCKVENEERERLYANSTVSLNRLPVVFKFEKTKSLSLKTIEFYIASRQCRCTCRCLFPLDFTYSSKKPSGVLVPVISERVHLVHLADSIPDSAMETVVARLWFTVRELRPQFQNFISSFPSNIQQLFSKEHSTMCDFEYLMKSHSVIFVVFHSVTTLRPNLSSANNNVFPIALLDVLPVSKVASLFSEKKGKICTVPIFRAVALRCSEDDDRLLQLHVVATEETTPLFSVSIQPSRFKPFRYYNWEYNRKWIENLVGFGPKDIQGNIEPNVMVSLLRWPSSANSSSFEGLEIFVEPLHVEPRHMEKDIVLCCKFVSGKKKASRMPSTYAHCTNESMSSLQLEDGAGSVDEMIAVMQSFDSHVSTPAYFFFPFTQLHDCKISLTFYASSHNAEVWWGSSVTSTVNLDICGHLKEAILLPKNKQGLKLKFSGDKIQKHATDDTVLFKQVNVILRWKKNEMEFLCESGAVKVKKSDLLLDEASILHFQSIFPPTNPSSPIISKEPGISNESFREAVCKMGQDILQLRKQNETLRKENRDYESYIMGMEASVVVTDAERKSLFPLTKQDLIDKVVYLSEHLDMETKTNKALQSKTSTLQNSLVKMNDIESSYLELREAHVAQQKLVRELQGKLVNYKKCLRICKQQELIINNLEFLLSEKAGVCKPKESTNVLSKESHLRAVLNEYFHPTGKDGHSHEKDKATIARLKEPGFVQQDKTERLKVEELKQKLDVAAVHERTVMQELMSNASKWAQEKAEYEQQLAELRSDFAHHDSHQPGQRRMRSEETLLPTEYNEDSSLNYSHQLLPSHSFPPHSNDPSDICN